MKVNITKKIGGSTLSFQVEGEKEVDALSRASGFTTIPEICGLCKSTDLTLDSNRAEGYIFVKIKCLKCNARSNMGQLKDGSGIFWKPFEKYVPKEKGGEK